MADTKKTFELQKDLDKKFKIKVTKENEFKTQTEAFNSFIKAYANDKLEIKNKDQLALDRDSSDWALKTFYLPEDLNSSFKVKIIQSDYESEKEALNVIIKAYVKEQLQIKEN